MFILVIPSKLYGICVTNGCKIKKLREGSLINRSKVIKLRIKRL